MKYILIIFLLNGGGVSAEFDTRPMCAQAKSIAMESGLVKWAECVPKG